MLLVTVFIGLFIGCISNLIIQTYPNYGELLELKSLYTSNIRGNKIYCLTPLVNTLLYIIIFYNTKSYIDQAYLSLLSTVFILIAYIDIKSMEIPYNLIVVGFIISILYKILNILFYKQAVGLLDSTTSAIIAIVFFSILFFISKKQMGGGDIHIAGLIGFNLGVDLIMISIILAFLFFIIIATLFYKKDKDINRKIPFAPFLIFAFYISLLYGEQILEMYRRF